MCFCKEHAKKTPGSLTLDSGRESREPCVSAKNKQRKLEVFRTWDHIESLVKRVFLQRTSKENLGFFELGIMLRPLGDGCFRKEQAKKSQLSSDDEAQFGRYARLLLPASGSLITSLPASTASFKILDAWSDLEIPNRSRMDLLLVG